MSNHKQLAEKDVRDLQRHAEYSLQRPASGSPAKKVSRAALLELIDLLSRFSLSGLAFVAGLGIYLGITAGAASPMRAAAWLSLLLAALWVSRRLIVNFRSGRAFSHTPFRWRATYTACLCVVGVIMASGPLLLAPPQPGQSVLVTELAVLAMLGGFGAALVHSAHLPSAVALALPGTLLPIVAAVRLGDSVMLAALGLLAVLGSAFVWVLNRHLVKRALLRHPWTSFVRREKSADRGSKEVRTSFGPAAHNAAS